ncbi:MAG: DMT family transporter [Steroidobacteraceae bacterium]
MAWIFILFVVLIGAGLPLQALVNARLGVLTAGSIFASSLSIVVSLIVALGFLLLQRPTLPPMDQLARLPLWLWVGGVVGGCYVIAATLGVPRVGAAGFVALIVLGQMIGSLILDHFGILHPAQPANATRILGVVLVMAGMLLVLQPWRR